MTSAHSHMKRPTGAEPGRDGPIPGRAGWDRSAGVWVSAGTGRCRVICNKDRSRSTALVPSLSREQISDAWGCFRSGLLPPGLPCKSSYP